VTRYEEQAGPRENNLRRAEELVAEGRRIVQQQKGRIIRLREAEEWIRGMPKEHFACSRRTCSALRNTETFSKVEGSYFPRTIVPDEGGAVVLDGPRQREAAGIMS
jgi:hypothetical protein